MKLGLHKRKVASTGQPPIKLMNGDVRDFESDCNGERQDHYLFTSAESPTLMGRSASPGTPPYGAKAVQNDVSKRHEGSTDSKSGSNAKGTYLQDAGRAKLPDLQIGRAKQVAGTNNSPASRVANTRPDSHPRSKSS